MIRKQITEAPGYGCQFPKDENRETEVSATSVSSCLDGGEKRKNSHKICFFTHLIVSLQQKSKINDYDSNYYQRSQSRSQFLQEDDGKDGMDLQRGRCGAFCCYAQGEGPRQG